MDIEQKGLLELANIGATKDCLFSEALLGADWSKMFELACRQGVASVCWRGIEILYRREENCCPVDVKLKWYARCEQLDKAMKKMFAVATEFANDVAPIKLAVLKGLDYSQFWPNKYWREFGDLDCYAIDGDIHAVDKRAEEIGCKTEFGDYKHSHIKYKGVAIENHHYFTAFGGSKKGKELECELQKLFKVVSSKDQGPDLLSPAVNFTAVFMVAHAQNHFFREGISLRHILDWHFFLTKERDNIDWACIKPILEKTGLMPFAVLLTQFCNKFFGLRFNLGSPFSDAFLMGFTKDVFAKKYSEGDRRFHMMIARMWHRFKRNIRFAEVNNIPVYSSVWKWIAYSSFLHRKPTLG